MNKQKLAKVTFVGANFFMVEHIYLKDWDMGLSNA